MRTGIVIVFSASLIGASTTSFAVASAAPGQTKEFNEAFFLCFGNPPIQGADVSCSDQFFAGRLFRAIAIESKAANSPPKAELKTEDDGLNVRRATSSGFTTCWLLFEDLKYNPAHSYFCRYKNQQSGPLGLTFRGQLSEQDKLTLSKEGK